jgi:uncharacterized membrane protein
MYLSLTIDSWTSPYSTDSYITVTYHFIEWFRLNSFVLETGKLAESHTAVNLHVSILNFQLVRVFYVGTIFFQSVINNTITTQQPLHTEHPNT